MTYSVSIVKVNRKTIGSCAVGLTHEELIGESHLLLRFDYTIVSNGCKLIITNCLKYRLLE